MIIDAYEKYLNKVFSEIPIDRIPIDFYEYFGIPTVATQFIKHMTLGSTLRIEKPELFEDMYNTFMSFTEYENSFTHELNNSIINNDTDKYIAHVPTLKK